MESFNRHVNAWGLNSPEGQALRAVVDRELLLIAGQQGYAKALAHASHRVDNACKVAGTPSGPAGTGSAEGTPHDGPLPETLPPTVVSCQEVIVYFSKHLLAGDYEKSREIVDKYFPHDDGSLWGALRSANGDPQLSTDAAGVAERICTSGPSS